MKKLSKENISQIIELYTNGTPPKEIGEKFGIANNSVTRLLKRKGIDRNQLIRVGDEKEKLIIRQYTIEGKSSSLIASDLKINDSTVSRVLKRNNIEIRLYEKTPKISQNYFEGNGENNTKTMNIEKYSTTYIPSYNGIQLTEKNLKKFSLKEKEKVIEFATSFFRNEGFPFPIMTENEITKSFTNLKNMDINSIEFNEVINPNLEFEEDEEINDVENDIINDTEFEKLVKNKKVLRIDNQCGAIIFKHFSPHFFEVSPIRNGRLSMLDSFNDDNILKKVIKNRVDGHFNLTGNMIRQGLTNSKLAYKTRTFNTAIAKYIYSKYVKENDIIYDYSMGFGQRLVAALSLKQKIKYIGVDAWKKSVKSNTDIFNCLNKLIPFINKDVSLLKIGAEDYYDPELTGKVNIAFSSPTRFNLEKYCDDESHSYNKNDYNYFLNTWWRKTANNIDAMLISGGLFIININDRADGFNIGEDMTNVMREKGYELIETYYIKLSKNLAFTKSTTHKLEPIYVFKKPTK